MLSVAGSGAPCLPYVGKGRTMRAFIERQHGMVQRPALVCVDLETTGASVERDRITEIGLVEVLDGEVQAWSSLVNPQQAIPPFITRLTGIDDAMVADAPHFDALAGEVWSRLQGKLFVAHNARFDYGFLKQAFADVGLTFRAPVLCTVKLSRKLYPQHYKHNLDALVERHQLPSDATRHRALSDARLLWHFLQAAEAELGAEVVWQAVAEMLQGPVLPPGLDAEALDQLPDGPGAYQLWGEQGPLYVGKASHLRKRILAHFSDKPSKGLPPGLGAQVRRIEHVSTCGELGASLLEAQWLQQHQPAANPQGRAGAEVLSWVLQRVGDEVFRPVLVSLRDPLPDGQACHGLYRSPREAQQALRKLAERYQLCLIHLGLEQPGRQVNSPCFAFQGRKCAGACVGREPLSFHSARLMTALGKLRLAEWPYPGPVLLQEPDSSGLHADWHALYQWRYLGSAPTEAAAMDLLQAPLPVFDAELYRILQSTLRRYPQDRVHRVLVRP